MAGVWYVRLLPGRRLCHEGAFSQKTQMFCPLYGNILWLFWHVSRQVYSKGILSESPRPQEDTLSWGGVCVQSCAVGVDWTFIWEQSIDKDKCFTFVYRFCEMGVHTRGLPHWMQWNFRLITSASKSDKGRQRLLPQYWRFWWIKEKSLLRSDPITANLGGLYS